MKKSFKAKLTLIKETLRELRSAESSLVQGGQNERNETSWTTCCPSICIEC